MKSNIDKITYEELNRMYDALEIESQELSNLIDDLADDIRKRNRYEEIYAKRLKSSV